MATHTTLTVQQPQAPRYPCDDLFDGDRRSDYLDIAVPLYNASIRGDLEAAKVILQKHDYVVRCSITEKKDTPLHVAAAGHSTKLVQYLVTMMDEADLKLRNRDHNTAFCIAAITGNVGMVQAMSDKNQDLLTICGRENMKPLLLAAYHGYRRVVTFLYDKSGKMMDDDWTDDERNDVLLKCIESNIFDVALRILEDNEKLPKDKYLWNVLHVLARKPEAFPVFRVHNFPPFSEIYYLVKHEFFPKESTIIQLLKLLWKRIMKKPKDFVDEILRGPMTLVQKSPGNMVAAYPSQIIFIAAKMNNKGFLVELIRGYPDLIWKKNEDEHTIFHVAVTHRCRKTFSLLYEIGSMKDLVASIADQHGNNILHLAGKKPEQNDYEDRLTAAFVMDLEFLWYKEVERILPPPCREAKNAAGQTPQQLFEENHKEPNLEGTKWMNDTVNVSMVVAALVCTISFSVIYSIPGGFNQNNGFPMFLHNKYFISFLELEAVSFIMSSSSIILFLCIMFSRHRNMEFLLLTWIIAQQLLLMSILFLVLAFCFSFFLLYRKTVWTSLLYYVAYLIIISCTTFCILCAAFTAKVMLYRKSSLLLLY